jgi:hypothetical protein
MFETNDFFQVQIEKCKRLAAGAVDKSDREFWLGLAERWAELLRARQDSTGAEGGTGAEIVRPDFAKRPAA